MTLSPKVALRVLAVAALAAAALGAFTARGGGAPGRRAHAQERVTFTRDVAPIVFEECASCHRPSGAAHFSLTTYEEVKSRAAQIAAATRSRAMPPWKPEPGYGTFAGERRLTDAQIATIQQWVSEGAPEGDPAARPPLKHCPTSRSAS